MAQKNFGAMAQTLIFGGFEPWLKPTFDMQILTSTFFGPGDTLSTPIPYLVLAKYFAWVADIMLFQENKYIFFPKVLNNWSSYKKLSSSLYLSFSQSPFISER